jgi:hypothetical protein
LGRTVCYNCSRSLDEKDAFRVHTGACDECFISLGSSADEELAAYLETVRVPAAILSQDLTVLLANARFRKTLGHDGIGLRGGEALDCMYSEMLGRCGETVACILCSLKRAVEHTLTSGEGLRGVSMSFPHKEEVRRTLAITTERLGASVLVLMVP